MSHSLARGYPLATCFFATCLFGACREDSACEENLGAQVIEERVEVQVGEGVVLAELADDAIERERGWRKRACDQEAILLVPDQTEPLPVWGCELVEPLDVVGIFEDEVVFVHRLEPCAMPCGGCPLLGEGVVVDAVLEVPAETLDVQRGDRAVW